LEQNQLKKLNEDKSDFFKSDKSTYKIEINKVIDKNDIKDKTLNTEKETNPNFKKALEKIIEDNNENDKIIKSSKNDMSYAKSILDLNKIDIKDNIIKKVQFENENIEKESFDNKAIDKEICIRVNWNFSEKNEIRYCKMPRFLIAEVIILMI